MSRCTGHCCKKYFINTRSNDALERDYLRYRETGDEGYRDNALVFLFSIPLEKEVSDHDNGAVGRYYTCTQFDNETGDCKIYDERPYMCSGFPYGNVCEYKGCTLTEEVVK